MVLDAAQKEDALLQVLKSSSVAAARILVFVAMRKQCDSLVRLLRKHQVQANAMHSDKDQQEREDALMDFRNGQAQVLVATDVAARGLDIKGVTLVVSLG
eukprot:symbB.v1.2.008677.t1/scaffold539.1/size189864/9